MTNRRVLEVPPEFSLAETCGPVAWGKGRWPTHDWIDGALVEIAREEDRVATRRARQLGPGLLEIEGDRDPDGDEHWSRSVLSVERVPPPMSDPVVAAIAARYPGMRPYSSGMLFDGIVSCIAGQSITVMAAAVTERRICALFHPGIEFAGRLFFPPPAAEALANAEPALLRTTGVTWRRAEAIVHAARVLLDGGLPSSEAGRADPDSARAALLGLPLVGMWTAQSVLLWSLGADDVFPPNDAALLRAARVAYADPALTHKSLEVLSEQWKPGRAWAARWLWTALLGPAPESDG